MSRLETTAWHEGGHLAAGIIHRAEIGPEGANIRRGHWQYGQAHVYVPIAVDALRTAWWGVVGGEQVDPALRDQVERNVYICLAGGMTEAVAEQRGLIGPKVVIDPAAPEHRPAFVAAITSGEPEPMTDSAQVDEYLRWLCTGSDEQAAYRRVLELRTDAMARSNPRFWPLAQAFAAALLASDALSGEQIAAVGAEVNGEETPMPTLRRTLKDAQGQPLDPRALYTPITPHGRGWSVYNPGRVELHGDHEAVKASPALWVRTDASSEEKGTALSAHRARGLASLDQGTDPGATIIAGPIPLERRRRALRNYHDKAGRIIHAGQVYDVKDSFVAANDGDLFGPDEAA